MGDHVVQSKAESLLLTHCASFVVLFWYANETLHRCVPHCSNINDCFCSSCRAD
jgi:hypothetical protein